MNYLQCEMDKAGEIKAQRATEQKNESLAVVQAVLIQAQERYARFPTSRNAYRVTEARERVKAARARETVTPRLTCQELRAEWQAHGGI